MTRRYLVLPVLLLTLAACHKDIQTDSAVRDGIMKYLATRTGLSEMEVTVRSVSFNHDKAQAMVHFQAKGNLGSGAGLDMAYQLTRQADHWVVERRAGEGARHGEKSPVNIPPSMLPGGASPAGSPALPAGHPAIPSPAPHSGPK